MPDITEQLNKYFKELDIDIEDFNNIALQLQKNNDILQSGLKSCNVSEFRNTYVINAQDSLDATYPMYAHFNIIDEMTKIVSIKLSFWLLPFRAYSTTDTEKAAATSGETGAPSGGGHTTVAGGGHTTATGGGHTTASGGGHTSGTDSGGETLGMRNPAHNTVTNVGDENEDGILLSSWSEAYMASHTHTHSVSNHTHTVADHQHTVADHQHAVADHTHPNHTHSIPAHTHGLTFGIHEEDNSPTVGFQISRDNGKTYGAILGKYASDVTNLEIKDYVTASGSYIIRFTSSARARLSVQATIKLDISAR